jgi:hypothetical protein
MRALSLEDLDYLTESVEDFRSKVEPDVLLLQFDCQFEASLIF